ncbi:MAG: transcription termination factor NusA [Bacilli bacterium]
MATRKQKNVDQNKLFLEAFQELAKEKGLDEASLVSALQESLRKALIKELNSGDDALVKVDVDLAAGKIDLFHQKYVVEDVQDDFLEIEVEEAQKVDPNLHVGDLFNIAYSIPDLSKSAINVLISYFQQLISRLEKAALYEEYADKIGELITGIVETIDENGASIKFGPNNVIYLSKTQMIPGEHLEMNKPVKVYVVDVESTSKGAQIKISRTHEGFLKRLMEEEIQELYDGTVVIKKIAREAGSRSKVAVYTTDPNVDPTGACIGPNGSRIQKVVSQLGNGPEKEKIDVITYNDNAGLFIMEALRPANVRGVVFGDADRKVTAVVENGNLSVAIGRRGVNVRLAVKITGWQIDIKENDEALAAGLRPVTQEELLFADQEAKEQALLDAQIAAIAPTPVDDIPHVASETIVVEEKVAEEVKPTVNMEKPVEESIKVAPAPVKPVTVEPTIQKVKTTKTLEELEAELEAEKKKAKDEPRKKYYKKPTKVAEESEEEALYQESDRMDIYTEEELAELDSQEQDDVDFDYNEDDEFWDEEVDKLIR